MKGKFLILCILMGFTTIHAQNVDLNSGLIAYYPFNGNVNDESGNNNHGKVYGATLTSDRNGNLNSAYKFDGYDDYIRVNDSDDLKFGYDDFSVAVWMKYGSQVGGTYDYSSIVSKGKVDRPWEGMVLHVGFPNSGNLQFRMTAADEKKNRLWFEGVKLNTDKWVHFVCIRANHTLKFYKNGELVQRKDVESTNITNDEPLWIGCNRRDTKAQNYDGIMDELRLYNRALNEQEVLELSRNTKPIVNKGVDIKEGLIAYYPFNGNAKDESGNGNHGKVFGNLQITEDRNGKAKSAYLFDGVDDYIVVPKGGNFKSDFSINFWVESIGDSGIILFKGENCPNGNPNYKGTSYAFGYGGRTSKCYKKIEGEKDIRNEFGGALFGGTGNYYDSRIRFSTLSSEFLKSTYYNVCWIFDSKSRKLSLYVDGKKYSEKNVRHFYEKGNSIDCQIIPSNQFNKIHSTKATLKIGAKESYCKTQDRFTQFFNGVIDDVRLYDRKLNECEIVALYNFDKNPSDKNYLTSCEELEIPKNAVKVTSKTVTVKIWDDAKEDGDIVSVYLNDARIKKEITVKKSEHIFTLELNPGVNTFKLFAHNEGSISPNTAAILIDDGTEEYERRLESKKDEFAELKIILK